MKWNLRLAAAQRDIWKASELQRMLAERGLVISAGKMSNLWSGQPASLKLDDLDVICAVLGCEISDLLIPEPEKVAARRAVAGAAGDRDDRWHVGRAASPRRPLAAARLSGGSPRRKPRQGRGPLGHQLRGLSGVGDDVLPRRVPCLLQLRRPHQRAPRLRRLWPTAAAQEAATAACAGAGRRIERPNGPNTPLAPYLRNVRDQQLFLADMNRRFAKPKALPRRRGAKGRPRKPPPAPAGRPVGWAQLALFESPQAYRYGRLDLRRAPAPDNPWLAWALHLAHAKAEARGFEPNVWLALQRNLVMLLADYHGGEPIRSSAFHGVLARPRLEPRPHKRRSRADGDPRRRPARGVRDMARRQDRRARPADRGRGRTVGADAARRRPPHPPARRGIGSQLPRGDPAGPPRLVRRPPAPPRDHPRGRPRCDQRPARPPARTSDRRAPLAVRLGRQEPSRLSQPDQPDQAAQARRRGLAAADTGRDRADSRGRCHAAGTRVRRARRRPRRPARSRSGRSQSTTSTSATAGSRSPAETGHSTSSPTASCASGSTTAAVAGPTPPTPTFSSAPAPPSASARSARPGSAWRCAGSQRRSSG